MTLRFRPMNVEAPRPTLFATIAEALDARRKRQQDLDDNQTQHANTMELSRMQMGLSPEMQAISARKDAQALQLKQQGEAEKQRKTQMAGLPELQASMGDPDKASAMAQSLGITDFQRQPTPEEPPLTASGKAVGDFFGEMNQLGGYQAEADGFGLQREELPQYKFTAGGRPMEMGATSKPKYAQAAADLDKYGESSSDQRLKDVVSIYQSQLARGEITPEKAATKIEEVQMKFDGMHNAKDIAGLRSEASERNAGRMAGLAYTRMNREDKRAEDKGDATNDRQLREAVATQSSVGSSFDRLDSLLSEGAAIPFTTAAELRKTAKKTIMLSLKKSEQMGTIDAGTIVVVDDMLGNDLTSNMRPELARAKLAEVRRYVDQNAKSRLESLRASKSEIRAGVAAPQANAAPSQQPAQRQPANAAEAATMRRKGKIDQDADGFLGSLGE